MRRDRLGLLAAAALFASVALPSVAHADGSTPPGRAAALNGLPTALSSSFGGGEGRPTESISLNIIAVAQPDTPGVAPGPGGDVAP